MDKVNDILVIIPARKNSKGIPGKNHKLLGGKPLVAYAIELAKQIVVAENICITTDSDEVIKVAQNMGLTIPFKRPESLATDTATTYEVLLHAIKFYELQGRFFKRILLLQPTSPFRTITDIMNCINADDDTKEMVTTFTKVSFNPFATLFLEQDGKAEKLFTEHQSTRRQDAGNVLQLNGAIYLIKIEALKQKNIGAFTAIKPVIMDYYHSVDLDEPHDWIFAEFLLEKRLIKI